MADGDGQVDLKLVNEFIMLNKEKDALEGRVEAIDQRLRELKVELSAAFIEANMQNIQVGDRKVYLARNLWSSFVPGDDLDNALAIFRKHQLDWMIKPTINGQTLSSWVREQERASDAIDFTAFVESLPEDLRSVLRISEVFDVRSVSAGQSR
jgi:hypothetical protein